MILIPTDGPVLVLDDNPADRMIIEIVIQRSNLSNPVRCFDSSQSLLDHLDLVARGQAPFPSLILLDINMPGLNGFDVLAQLKAQPAFQTRPVVTMLSSSDAPEDESRAASLGASGYIAKVSGVEAFVTEVDATFSNAVA